MGDKRRGWYVGIKEGKWDCHCVFSSKTTPTKELFPQYQYVTGPFASEDAAQRQAGSHINQEMSKGMFRAAPGDPR